MESPRNIPTKRGIDIRLFGPMRLFQDGVENDLQQWKSKKALTLLKLLAERCGARFPKDVLIDALWSEDADFERSSHNLHTVVYYLRRELEPGLKRYERAKVVRQSSGLYWLEDGADVRVDVKQFRRLLREADGCRGREPKQALPLYKQALALYTDDFLPENLYDDWAAGVREELREMYVAGVAAAAELTEKLGEDPAWAIGLCRRALHRDALREELHRALIYLLARQGLYGEAAEQYRQCARILHDEFQVPPSPATRIAYERVIAAAAESAQIVHRVSGDVPSVGATAERTAAEGETAGSATAGGVQPGLGDRETAPGGFQPGSADPEIADAAAPGAGDGAALQPDLSRAHLDGDGPTMCGPETYLLLHKLELSRQAHTGLPLSLLRIGLGAGLDGPGSDEADRARCVTAVRTVLRAGDVFCWESPGRLLIQLPATGREGALLVKARLEEALERVGLVFFDLRYVVLEGARGFVAAAAESDPGQRLDLESLPPAAGQGRDA